MASVNVGLVVFSLLFVSLTSGKEAFFDAVPKELRCSGCEITVKVLDHMMRSPSKNLAKHVDEVIASVCDEKRFEISEYKASTMLKVCRFIKEYHETELRSELVKYYAHPRRSTYFEFGQHFCIDTLKLCAAVFHKNSKNENVSSLHFDSKTHDFYLKAGDNVKVPQPVRDNSHDEL